MSHKSIIPPGKQTADGERVLQGITKTINPNRPLQK